MDDFVEISKREQFLWGCFGLFVLLAGAGLIVLVGHALVTP